MKKKRKEKKLFSGHRTQKRSKVATWLTTPVFQINFLKADCMLFRFVQKKKKIVMFHNFISVTQKHTCH